MLEHILEETGTGLSQANCLPTLTMEDGENEAFGSAETLFELRPQNV
jgi:hypothetical protein